MPIFDYKCDKCGFTDEFFESISVNKDLKAPEKCPKCGEGKLEKQFSCSSRVGFDLRGSGFYTNDYGKHAWEKNLSTVDQASVLLGEKDPY